MTLSLLTFSTLYPNDRRQHHGIFVENRLRHLVASGAVTSTVVAPVPWFPSQSPLFGDWALNAGVPATETRHGLTVHHPRYPVIPRIGMSIAPHLLYWSALPTVQRLMGTGKHFDAIDAHYVYPDGLAAIWIGQKLGLPTVVTARGTDINLIPRYTGPRHLIRRTLPRASALVAVSAALKNELVALGQPADRISVLRNGVDTTLFRPAERTSARATLDLKRRTLLSVGHLIERKGHDRIIEAMIELPDYDLLIVGEGPERQRLIGLAHQFGVSDRVRLLGAKPHAEMPKIYTAADALVPASSREGWANVLLESMACGTPVIASNVWGNPEVVRAPEAGVVANDSTPHGLAAAIRDLFAHLPSRCDTQAYAQNFSWDETTAGQISLFESLCSSSSQLGKKATVGAKG